MKCLFCGKKATQIDYLKEHLKDYNEYAKENNEALYIDESQFIREQEGTYDKDTDTFVCDDCYVNAGAPSNSTLKRIRHEMELS